MFKSCLLPAETPIIMLGFGIKNNIRKIIFRAREKSVTDVKEHKPEGKTPRVAHQKAPGKT